VYQFVPASIHRSVCLSNRRCPLATRNEAMFSPFWVRLNSGSVATLPVTVMLSYRSLMSIPLFAGPGSIPGSRRRPVPEDAGGGFSLSGARWPAGFSDVIWGEATAPHRWGGIASAAAMSEGEHIFESKGAVMTNIIESAQRETPRVSARAGVRLDPAAPGLWRVRNRAGFVIGHLQAMTEVGGTRFRARRFHAATHCFRDLGDFWSADDAVECLRLGR